MIVENDAMPICRDHVERIMHCHPCQLRLMTFWRSMPKAAVRLFSGMTPFDYWRRKDEADLENQTRLHDWAMANLYADPNVLTEPF